MIDRRNSKLFCYCWFVLSLILVLPTVTTAFVISSSSTATTTTTSSISTALSTAGIPIHGDHQVDTATYVIPSDLLTHRCYYQKCTTPIVTKSLSKYSNNTNTIDVSTNRCSKPLLVICIGMAQTIDQYIQLQHVSYFVKERDVLVYQAEGLGLHYNGDDRCNNSNNNNNNNTISLPNQAKQLLYAVKYYTNSNNSIIPIDLVGFSLGGRIALATAVSLLQQQQQQQQQASPNIQIQKIHLTGVSMQRSEYGIIQSMIWKDHLTYRESTGEYTNIRAFGWSILSAAYSPQYLVKNQHHLLYWIDRLCQSHTASGLLHLIEQTYDTDTDADCQKNITPTNTNIDSSNIHYWSVRYMTQQLVILQQNADSTIQFRFIVGEYDILAPRRYVYDIAFALSVLSLSFPPYDTTVSNYSDSNYQINTSSVDNTYNVVVVPNVGHAVPIEASRTWRHDINTFLNG